MFCLPSSNKEIINRMFKTFDLVGDNFFDEKETSIFKGHADLQNMIDRLGHEYRPATSLVETDESYIVSVDLPGIEKEKINVTVYDNSIDIQAERVNENKNTVYSYSDMVYGKLKKAIKFKKEIDTSKDIKALYKNGVLSIEVFKAIPKKKTVKVDISS